jgi:hypothetical protein
MRWVVSVALAGALSAGAVHVYDLGNGLNPVEVARSCVVAIAAVASVMAAIEAVQRTRRGGREWLGWVASILAALAVAPVTAATLNLLIARENAFQDRTIVYATFWPGMGIALVRSALLVGVTAIAVPLVDRQLSGGLTARTSARVPEPKPVLILLLVLSGVLGGAFWGGYLSDWHFKRETTQAYIWLGGALGAAIGVSLGVAAGRGRILLAGILGFTASVAGLGAARVVSGEGSILGLGESWVYHRGLDVGVPMTVLMVWAHDIFLRHRWSWGALAGAAILFGVFGAWSGAIYWAGVPSMWSGPALFGSGGIWRFLESGTLVGLVFGWFQLLGMMAAAGYQRRFGAPGEREE